MSNCPTNKEETCYDLSISNLLEIVYGADRKIISFAEDKSNILYYGFGSTYPDKEIAESEVYKNCIKKYIQRKQAGAKQCLETHEIGNILEAIIELVPKRRCGQEKYYTDIDDSGLDKWVANNPYCVSYEEWNRYSKQVCSGWKISANLTEEKQCKLVFDITRDVITCELIYLASLVKRTCELNYTVKRTEEECKLDWELLMNKIPECTLDYKTYTNLIKCNLTYDIIYKILSEGTTIQSDGVECTLYTDTGNTYTLDELALRNIPTQEDLIAPGIDVPQFEMSQYISDYNLTKEQINKL